MPPLDPVADYLKTLTHELRFDAALANRVRREVEDHLREAAAEPSDCTTPIAAQRRAIARFGEPRMVARQYAPGALLVQTRRGGIVVLIALAGIYAMMKARLAWYGFTQWSLSPDLAATAATVFSVVRWVFIVALAVAVVGAAYIGSRRPPREFHDAYWRELACSVGLCAIAVAVLLVAIGLDGIMVGLRLVGRETSAAVLIPILSMTVEALLAAVLVCSLRGSIERVTIARTLLAR
jgi:HAAS domain-containing protein